MKQVTGMTVVLALGLVWGAYAVAADQVGVPGVGTRYDTAIERSVGNKPVKMVLTGTALRKRLFFKVYAIGSYVEQGTQVRSAKELADVDCAKQLHLVMARDVSGKEMAEAFEEAIRASYAPPTFNKELESLLKTMRSLSVNEGDHVLLSHVPKKGLHCQIVGKQEFFIENKDFSRAVWVIYLGKNNIDEAIKRSLVSRL